MKRDKVLELAREAGFNWPEISTTTIEERLERFAALIEAEMCKHQADKFCETHCSWTDHHVDCDQVRWDAEPVGYTNEGYKGMQYANAEAYKEIRSDFIERNKLTAPLFAHPAPAVVRQLVDALRMVLDDPDLLDGRPRTYECVQEALAAAKQEVL